MAGKAFQVDPRTLDGWAEGDTDRMAAHFHRMVAEMVAASVSGLREHPGHPDQKVHGHGSGKTEVDASGRIVTSSTTVALKALYEGKAVELRTTHQVSTLLSRLAKQVDAAVAAGDKAPNIDMCKVSVAGTNLFCAQSKGIPRVQMPQMGGRPVPGSAADRLPKDKNGEVDGSEQFVAYLRDKGIAVESGRVPAANLRASQSELVGAKVAGMVRAAKAGQYDPSRKPIFVSADDYVIDGHHRWAATVGLDAADGHLGDRQMNVTRVNTDIITILNEANKWAKSFGIAPKVASTGAGG